MLPRTILFMNILNPKKYIPRKKMSFVCWKAKAERRKGSRAEGKQGSREAGKQGSREAGKQGSREAGKRGTGEGLD
jgi:hypothetical protein